MDVEKRILIAGGSGLIGTRLTQILSEIGYEVFHLSRGGSRSKTKSFRWDIEKSFIEPAALNDIGVVINLSGSNVAAGRWTAKRKREILESRTRSTRLIFDQLARSRHQVKTFICASGVGYYGAADEHTSFREEDRPGTDFLAGVTVAWEREADNIATLGIRVVKVRIGVVLSERGGALQPIVRTVRAFAGAPLGSGRQYISWVHIDDLCRMMIHAIRNQHLQGPFNAVTSQPVTNAELTRAVASELKRPLILPNVPGFVLRSILGEMASIVLEGAKASNEKIRESGFEFQFGSLEAALHDLLGRNA